MKRFLNYWPFLLALIPQFVFTNYLLVIITTVLTGLIASWFITQGKVFGPLFILELVAFFIFFLTVQDRVFYLKDVLKQFGLPEFFLFIIIPVFNALNISILFFTGYILGRLLTDKLKLKTAL